MREVVLETGSKSYGGWTAMRIVRGMEALAGTFTFEVSELWPGQGTARRIEPGAACSVKVDGKAVITGYVDELDVEHDAKTHTVRVSGRDKTADLVDCSAIHKGGQWRGRTIAQIAADLCAPFGIQVKAATDVGKPLPTFALQEGETVFEALARLARIRALLLESDASGNLVITRAGAVKVGTALVLGENILSVRGSVGLHDRFSEYVAKGQAAGSDDNFGQAVSQISATATDGGVPRYRPMVLLGESQDVAASLKQRVQWEANVRAARSMTVEVVVQGWEHAGGLWQPNTLVRVIDSELRLDDDLLIVTVTFELGEAGTLTQLLLTRADAYSLLPIKAPTVVEKAANKPYFTPRAEGAK